MPVNSPLRKFVDKVNQYPSWLSRFLMTRLFRHLVKLAGTAKVDIVHTDGKTVTFKIKNRRKVRNHIGTVHAASMALLAESATGFIVGINLPANKLPLIKNMNLNYVKRSQGDITAVASLTDEQITLMQQQDKGEVSVKVTITDGVGIVPLEAEMIWAWIPKK
ncbi:DUF4442 domain-containing protein [Aliiglaciecola lipolytica]|uniref:DUF4442 domain-containing protein n=1 Tax=Aliiglaciecola lipolytica E3 TaxID=1127673 RepID=K6YHK0_9ALTE|nr:DUF4442 domain-containing protein [Aliiglaciecola lipolytica]GAC16103.1 conserved hypothetical protein [Aliiglaciecola lipolytica E3]